VHQPARQVLRARAHGLAVGLQPAHVTVDLAIEHVVIRDRDPRAVLPRLDSVASVLPRLDLSILNPRRIAHLEQIWPDRDSATGKIQEHLHRLADQLVVCTQNRPLPNVVDAKGVLQY
jgi:hypothetical protein